MIIRSKTLITLLYLALELAPCYSLNAQVPFFLNHHPSLEQQNTLQLKTIYHHGSANGPIPKLFRKLELPQTAQKFSLKSKQGVMDRPSAADRNDLLLKMSQSSDRLVRWNTVAEEDKQYRAMQLESTIGILPDVTDRASIVSLAQMSNNAYLDIDLNNTEWFDLGSSWHLNNSFGWESDGLRGHLFANEDESLIVIGIKGTSAGLWTGGPTGEKDKINDNMLFSCCCARISRAWSPVCDCYQGNEYKCETSCLQEKTSKAELYYDNALAIYKDVHDKYENSTIWLTGHSLGGAIASLVGITFGVPTVTFEIPGDKLASERLHLPKGPGIDLPVWHFGHTADPIFVGVCNGPSSSCWYGGYAMETRCHTGKVCVWDTVKDNGWRVDIRSHRVRDVIDGILMKPEEFPLPTCVEETDCQDCGLWEYYDDRDPVETGTTSLTTSTTEAVTSTTDAVTSTTNDATSTTDTATITTTTTTTTTADTQPSATTHEPPTDPWPN